MANIDKNRLEDFSVEFDRIKYTLYVRDGEPVRIKCLLNFDDERHFWYSDYHDKKNKPFWKKFKIIVYVLCKRNDTKSLKKLYNSLNTGILKDYLEEKINELIDFYEKAIEDLKS